MGVRSPPKAAKFNFVAQQILNLLHKKSSNLLIKCIANNNAKKMLWQRYKFKSKKRNSSDMN